MKTFNEYQDFTESLARYNTDVSAMLQKGHTSFLEVPLPMMYPVLALAEEAGEVAGKLAKFVRKHGTDTDELARLILPELGDVMYAVSETARQMGYTLQDVIDANVSKLSDRADRGVLIGEGDYR